jgi:BirA family biotin operon repressor/biotin-[acetyl-CoA-carboxylase] ligase
MTLDPNRLAEIGERLVVLESASSTNDEAMRRAAEGAPHGTLVVAETQTAGRGRQEASWFYEPGSGLAFSVVVRPGWDRDQWGWLALATGLAVAEVLEQRGLEAAIKWPNDILVDGRKNCGILVEAEKEAAVVGIGINVNEEHFPEGLEAVSLRQALGQEQRREEILAEVWQRLLEVIEWEPPIIAEAAWHRLAWRGRIVETRGGERGVIRGFRPEGALLLECAGGLVPVTAGDSLRLAGTFHD